MIAVDEPRVALRFAGRRSGSEKGGSLEGLAAELAPEAPPLAWARQIHSAIVLEARAGLCGEGDALFTERTDLALGVVTADCVPVLLAGARAIAAAHAGWRGLAAGVLPRTVERLVEAFGEQPADLQAWIGPAIGPCCYEVSDEVADQVARASTRKARRPGTGERPVLDLHRAAAAQLAQAFPALETCDEAEPAPEAKKAEPAKPKPKAVAPPPAPPPSLLDEFRDNQVTLIGAGVIVLILFAYGVWSWRRKKGTQAKFSDSVLGPGGGTAGRTRLMRRSLLVTVPSFSPQVVAGSSRSA